jgi:hypothetical protein
LGRLGDKELMGREPLNTTMEKIVPVAHKESIHSVINLESVYGVTMILSQSYFKCIHVHISAF